MPVVEVEVVLRACPFCGASGIIKSERDWPGKQKISYWVKCSNAEDCAVSPKAAVTVEAAAESWNRRNGDGNV